MMNIDGINRTGVELTGYRSIESNVAFGTLSDQKVSITETSKEAQLLAGRTDVASSTGLKGKVVKLLTGLNNSIQHMVNRLLNKGSYDLVSKNEAKLATQSVNNPPSLESSREMKRELIHDLVSLIEEGHGGERALMGQAFEKTTEKLNVLMVKVSANEELKHILEKSKGFSTPPKTMVGVDISHKNMYEFLKTHTSRELNSETFCIQSMVSDLKHWTAAVIDKQSHAVGGSEQAALKSRLAEANNIDDAEYKRNPASRQPETTEEAVQYLHYATGLFEDEEQWQEYAKEPMQEMFSGVEKLSYTRARNIYEKNLNNGVYS